MEQFSISLWFPSYGLSKGSISKALRNTIQENFRHFGIKLTETYYTKPDTFVIDGTIESLAHLEYISNALYKRYGAFFHSPEITDSQTYLGRLVNPGKVGFGIFVDIGIRDSKRSKDILIPLRHMREMFDPSMKLSLRDLTKLFGLLDGLPIEVAIDEIITTTSEKDESVSYKIIGRPSEVTLNTFEMWMEDGLDRVIIPKTFKEEVDAILQSTEIIQYIDEVISIDPITTILVCKKGTRASGLIPKLGPKVGKVKLGIFSQQRLIEMREKYSI